MLRLGNVFGEKQISSHNFTKLAPYKALLGTRVLTTNISYFLNISYFMNMVVSYSMIWFINYFRAEYTHYDMSGRKALCLGNEAR